MKFMIRVMISFSFLIAVADTQATEFKPAVVFASSNIFDETFNQTVFHGSQHFAEDTGIVPAVIAVSDTVARRSLLEQLARHEYSPIIAVGFLQANDVSEIASLYPDVQISIIDAVVNLPNVQSITFKEHEGSFLVGAVAAMSSKTGKVGFVGGMDVPLIRKFACGYSQGVHHVDPQIQVTQEMVGKTVAAWNNPQKAEAIASSQFDQGADVIFAAAGTSGLGVLKEAAERNLFSIGVDSNQNFLYPGSVLTSMLKRVDIAAYAVLESANRGEWRAGHVELGLAENGVGWSLDENNEMLITQEMRSTLERMREQIISGEIIIHDYTVDNKCTY